MFGEYGYDEEEFDYHKNAKNDLLLFLVDVNSVMFETICPGRSSTSSPFTFSLELASKFLSTKIIQSPNDYIGLIFFGTEKKKNEYDFPGIYVYHDIDNPSAERIKDIEGFIRTPGEKEVDSDRACKLVMKEFGISTKKAIDLHNLLWTCQNMMTPLQDKTEFKRIFLFTSRDDPFLNDTNEMKRAVSRAYEMMENHNIEIRINCFEKPGADFNPTKFWKRLEDNDSELYSVCMNPVQNFCPVLLERGEMKTFNKRALSSMNWELSPGMIISVQLFNLFISAKKANPVKVNRDDNAFLKCETKLIDSGTGEEILNPKMDLLHRYNYGGKDVFFNQEEIDDIKSFGKQMSQKGLKLLGFKPLDRLKDYQNIKPSGFLYPDESQIRGSRKLFVGLHRRLLEKKMMAICRFKLRNDTMPVNCALVPQEERKTREEEDELEIIDDDEDDDVDDEVPNGFNIIYLPYSEGIRNFLEDLEPHSFPDLTEEENIATTELVTKLSLEDWTNVTNPALTKHYQTLKNLALGQSTSEEDETFVDPTQPDTEGFERHKETIINFRNVVLKDIKSEVKNEKRGKRKRTTGRKRKRSEEDAEDEQEPPRKKLKSEAKKEEESDSDSSSEEEALDFVDLAKKGKLNTLTVPTLKQFLRMYKLKVGGKKAELVERIVAYLRERGKIE